jgi:hypothetical protein
MTVFYIVLVIGVVVAVAYLSLAFEEFKRARHGRRVADDESPEAFERQGRGFSLVAGGGVVVSTTLLVLISVSGAFWYLLPLLGIGSALAVIVAFVVDRSEALSEAEDELGADEAVAA